MTERRGHTGEPATRLYEAILHLRRLGHQVRRHGGGRLHVLDGTVVSEATLLEIAMTRFRRAPRLSPLPVGEQGAEDRDGMIAAQAGRTAPGCDGAAAEAGLRP